MSNSFENKIRQLEREKPLRVEVLPRTALLEHGRELARSCDKITIKRGWFGTHRLHRRFTENWRLVRDAYFFFASASKRDEQLTAGAEWILDNFHIIDEQVREIKRNLPSSYYLSLPRLNSDDLRVYRIIEEFITYTDSVVDAELLSAFIEAFQERETLLTGEVWAIPSVFRLALIENLRRLAVESARLACERRRDEAVCLKILRLGKKGASEMLVGLLAEVEKDPHLIWERGHYIRDRLKGRGSASALCINWIDEQLVEKGITSSELRFIEEHNQASDQISVGNCVTSLKKLDSIDWRKWFESVSKVDKILREDPAGIYHRSDFLTRDQQRHIVEELARDFKMSESSVAREVIALSASENAALDQGLKGENRLKVEEKLKGHVGYYLIDKGVEKLLFRLAGHNKEVPIKYRFEKFFEQNKLASYLFCIAFLTLIIALLFYNELSLEEIDIILGCILTLLAIPIAIETAQLIVQFFSVRFVPSKPLAKLDFKEAIPESFRTAVVMQIIVKSQADIERAVSLLKIRAAANYDPNLAFGVLVDLNDADSEVKSGDQGIINRGLELIGEVNRHLSPFRQANFFIAFRKRIWCESEGKFIAWERKRGKISEFNRLIRGAKDTNFATISGDLNWLAKVRYIITLDADTGLPPESAKLLVGTIAHPLNNAHFLDNSQTISRGHAIIQARVSMSLESATASTYAKLNAGAYGLDPYASVVSEVYQDLFDSGSFCGKGIYEVDSFERALERRFPEQRILSHDLIEGSFAHAALASDIELIDEYPSNYFSQISRVHRWIRGDWQIAEWTLPKVPSRLGHVNNSLNILSRWKIFDNLRRSLFAPAALLLLIMAPIFNVLEHALLLVILPLVISPFFNLAGAFSFPPPGYSLIIWLKHHLYQAWLSLLQGSSQLLFLPYTAFKSLDAVVRALYRTYFSKKYLLEWVTAHEAQNSSKLSLFDYYIKFLPALFLPLVSLFAALQLDSESRWMILSVAALWLLAPLVGWIAAKPYRSVSRNLSEDDKNYALGIAKNTWHYFDKYLNQKYNYLIPDNLQTVPVDTVAERTSPTNISLSVLALLSAYDLGFISLPQFIERSAKVFDTLSRLERYHGHFFNWYDINSLAVLNPRYISSVDSGNLLGHFVALRSELKSLDKNALVTRNYFSNLTSENFTLQDLYQRSKNSAENEEDKALLQVLLGWIDKIKILKELAKNGKLPRKLEKIDHVIERRKATLSLLHKLIRRLLRIETVTSLNQEEQAQVQELIVALKEANQKIELLFKAVQKIVELIDLFEGEMDFKFLYDEERGLLSIGYRCDIGQRDRSYYDLLASEARLASLVAIAKGDLPEKHWFMLGRNLTDAAGSISLLSWSGTMFEYLMPLIVTKDFPETLLSYTYQAVVKAQRRYGARRGVPWGISESGFSGVDFHRTYQYNAFGVPGLGLKRGLADDLVISPYSSLLAVMIEPHAALQNLRRIEQIGGRGELGFFEALDFTPERLRNDENCHMVRSFFAHHQGMSLAAINNLLNSGILQKRFHSDSLIKAYEILLHEQFPKRVSLILPHQAEVLSLGEKHEAQRVDASQRFENALSPTPKLRLLSNRRLSTVIDDAGNGGTFLTDNIQLTRYRTDEQFGRFGFYIYIKNLKNKKFWSTTYQPTLVEPDTQEIFFNFDKVEFKRRDQDISLHSEITVSPEDNVEIRRVKISNHNTKDKAQLELTSFAEVSLNSFQSDLAHQAFTKLFIESEFLEEYDALIFTKRPRSEKDKTIFLAHAVTMPLVWAPCQYTTSRESFIGRGHDLSSPQAMLSHERLDQRCGYVIDPIMSLRVLVELEANRSLDVAFIMITANSREECLRLLSKYREPHFVERAFELSWSHSDIEVRHEMFAGGKVAAYQELIKALLYPIEELKAPQSLAKRNQLAQNALWRFGISGDEAIVLIEAGNGDSLALVDELLQAHEYLKQRGIRFDLVILNDDPGGYLQELQNEITHLVNLRFAREKLDQRGGVFIRSSFKLSADELCLLYASARIYLKSSQGSLEERLAEVGSQSNKHHQALAQRNNSQIVKWASLPREIREFDNKLGGFVNDGTAYALNVSMKNLPPKPWSNLVALPNFGFLVTERGGGYTWAGNSRENRLTPWENDAVIDLPHEVVYIRDLETMQYWSPTPISPQAEVKVTHAAGFSRFDSLVNNLSTRLTLTIDHQHSIKWFALDMTNNQLDERSFEFILYLDFVLGINKEQTEQYLNFNYQKQSERLEIRNSFNIEFGNGCAWIGSSEKIKGFSTLRAEFLGRHSRVDAPNLLESSRFERQSVSSKLSNRVASGSDRCGVLVSQLKLTPGENKKILFYLAYTQDPSQIDQIDKQAKSLKRYEAALIWHANEWRERCGVIKVKTPERSFDILVNHWLLYQTLACRIFARTGLYQSSGAIGFRDQLQDSLAALYANPTLTRSQILLNASRQFKEGDVQHWWHPPSGRGVRTLISDNYIWLIYATARYVKFTADLSILDVEVPFLHGDPIPEGAHDFYFTPTATVESATLYQHCKLAIERALTKLSERGIPLIGGGDWNDGLSQVGPEGRGESTWLGWFLVTALKEFSPLVEGVEGGAASERLKACADEISTAIDQYCWNGEWYERATFDDGTPLGVKGRSECEIDSIAQSWSVLSKEDLTKSGDLPPHSRLAIESAYQHLFDKQHQVIRLLWPPFDKSKPHPGYIQGYPPGVRENGGQYTHAATWLIAAFARAGDGERALELFNAANPILHTFTPELVSTYQAEPYALCGDVLSAGELAGRAGWSWYTGSSAWLYRVAIEEILGIKIQGWQIKFQPAVPKSWKQFFVAITLKGVKLELDFKRHKVATEESATFTVQVLTKDAEVEEDCLILPDAAGKVIKAEVLF